MFYSYTTYVIDAVSVWNVVGWLLLLAMLFGVWRLWRGMRLDAFERGLRALREGRSTVGFSRRQPGGPRGRGPLRISLLPLMLLCCGAAMLLAQAQRPDDVSRPVTWALFVAVATWYGTARWPHLRGVGPLRNYALAGVISGVGISAVLWGFYLGVDTWWGEIGYERVTASFSSLLWWSAAGGVIGGLVGAFRADRVYATARQQESAQTAPPTSCDELAIQSAPRARRVAWGALAMACCASLLFHLSAVPHLYRPVEMRFWVWHWDAPYYHGNGLALTMAPVPAPQVDMGAVDIGAVDLTKYPGGDIAWWRDVPAAVSYRDGFIVNRVSSTSRPMVLTPNRPIAEGQQITREMLTFMEFDGRLTVITDIRAAAGRVAREPLAIGQPIQEGQLALAGANRIADPYSQFVRLQLAGDVESKPTAAGDGPLTEEIETEITNVEDLPDVDPTESPALAQLVNLGAATIQPRLEELAPQIVQGGVALDTGDVLDESKLQPASTEAPIMHNLGIVKESAPVDLVTGSRVAEVVRIKSQAATSGGALAQPQSASEAPAQGTTAPPQQVTVWLSADEMFVGQFVSWMADGTIKIRNEEGLVVSFTASQYQRVKRGGLESQIDFLPPSPRVPPAVYPTRPLTPTEPRPADRSPREPGVNLPRGPYEVELPDVQEPPPAEAN